MTELLIILGACIIGLFVGLIARNENPGESWKPKKKNFFERLGETGDPVHFSTPQKHKKRWKPQHTPQKHSFKWKW